MQANNGTLDVVAAIAAGVFAGVVSTLAQIALWAALGEALPAILFRDARLAAAIVLGADALALSDSSLCVLAVATLVHFSLSIAYGVAIGWLVRRRGEVSSLAIGAAFGAVVYAFNMQVMTYLWPWFTATRDPITFVAHLVFGASAAWAYRRLVAIRRARIR